MQTGPSGVRLNSQYDNRDKEEYQLEVGNVLINLARIVPDGLLVFFPSYIVMEKCLGMTTLLLLLNCLQKNGTL